MRVKPGGVEHRTGPDGVPHDLSSLGKGGQQCGNNAMLLDQQPAGGQSAESQGRKVAARTNLRRPEACNVIACDYSPFSYLAPLPDLLTCTLSCQKHSIHLPILLAARLFSLEPFERGFTFIDRHCTSPQAVTAKSRQCQSLESEIAASRRSERSLREEVAGLRSEMSYLMQVRMRIQMRSSSDVSG